MDAFNCPVTVTTHIIGGKWKPSILFYLQGGIRRFSELQKLLSGPTKKMLTQQLRELERDDIIRRKIYAQVPPRVEYSLTRHGESLRPILGLMSAWGKKHRARHGGERIPLQANAHCSVRSGGGRLLWNQTPSHGPKPSLELKCPPNT